MSTVPSRLLSNRSKMRGAIGISNDMFIAFSTSSNSDRVALSPFAHLHIYISPLEYEKLIIGQSNSGQLDVKASLCNLSAVKCW
jgi:hypothetical protein